MRFHSSITLAIAIAATQFIAIKSPAQTPRAPAPPSAAWVFNQVENRQHPSGSQQRLCTLQISLPNSFQILFARITPLATGETQVPALTLMMPPPAVPPMIDGKIRIFVDGQSYDSSMIIVETGPSPTRSVVLNEALDSSLAGALTKAKSIRIFGYSWIGTQSLVQDSSKSISEWTNCVSGRS